LFKPLAYNRPLIFRMLMEIYVVVRSLSNLSTGGKNRCSVLSPV